MRLLAALSLTALLDGASVHVPFWPADATSIQASVNGAPSKVLRVQTPASDLLLLIVLDLAGDLSLVDPGREALIGGIEKLPANTYVGLLRAQDGLHVLVDPGPNRAPVVEAIRDLPISGHAGLLDTVETATSLGDSILARAKVRLAVLYVTDSSISNYREDYTNPVVNASDSRDMSRRFPEGLVKEKIQQLHARLSETESPLFIVHLNYQSDRLNEAYQTGLMELATATGGTAEFCRSVADIPDAMARMLAGISEHQSAEIEYKPSKNKKLEVELATEGKSLRYRNRFHLKKKSP